VAEPRFLTFDEVLYLHDESLVRFGGSSGIRDKGRVESALGAAENTYWYGRGGEFEIAAASACHLAESPAFLDGNKRTGAAAAIMFLTLNGVIFPMDDGSVYRAMIEIANRKLDKQGLATVLRVLAGKLN
jgi:death-on-curing protein